MYFIQDLFVTRQETPSLTLWLLTVITAVGINELNREVIKVSNDERPVKLNRETCVFFISKGEGADARSEVGGGGFIVPQALLIGN